MTTERVEREALVVELRRLAKDHEVKADRPHQDECTRQWHMGMSEAYDDAADKLAAALSGREAVATVCLRGDTYAHGLMTELQVQHAEGVEFPIGTKLYTTPQPGDGVVVPRWLLEQVYGMAREGCDAPTAAYRWCERIDGLFHGDESPEEYAEFAEALPVSFPAAPTAEGVAE